MAGIASIAPWIIAYLGIDMAKEIMGLRGQERMFEKQAAMGKEARGEQRKARGMLLKKTKKQVKETRQRAPLDALTQAMMASILPPPEARAQMAAQAMAPLGTMAPSFPVDYGNTPLSLAALYG